MNEPASYAHHNRTNHSQGLGISSSRSIERASAQRWRGPRARCIDGERTTNPCGESPGNAEKLRCSPQSLEVRPRAQLVETATVLDLFSSSRNRAPTRSTRRLTAAPALGERARSPTGRICSARRSEPRGFRSHASFAELGIVTAIVEIMASTEAKAGFGIAWLLGIPLPILAIVYLITRC